jgi:AraC-like DNA-binding protein
MVMDEPDESIDLAHWSAPSSFAPELCEVIGSSVLNDCATEANLPGSVAVTRPAPGIEMMRASFFGHAFSAHRHDTYGIGLTTLGVQTFDYRGETRQSPCGHAFVLHPDEMHDGRAGDARGFGYQIAYVEPSLIFAASGGRGLPFVCTPVVDDPRFKRTVSGFLSTGGDLCEEVAVMCGVAELTDALWHAADQPRAAEKRLRLAGLYAARDALRASKGERISAAELERISDLNRWELARQFRRAFGVSPYRFQQMRRLEQARKLLATGARLADTAVDCGFSDQAHFTRQFQRAYGMSPGRWRALEHEPNTRKPRRH